MPWLQAVCQETLAAQAELAMYQMPHCARWSTSAIRAEGVETVSAARYGYASLVARRDEMLFVRPVLINLAVRPTITSLSAMPKEQAAMRARYLPDRCHNS